MVDAAKLISFEEALANAGDSRPNLLLGNGFSIAWRADVFSYERLLESADFSGVSVDGHQLFDALETSDFERVIEALRTAAVMADVYEPKNTSRSAQLRADAEKIRDELARVIASRHPDLPDAVSPEEFEQASAFLAHFEHLYTVNYDLLLYWTAMHRLHGIVPDDGFRTDREEPEAEWVTWDSTGRARSQSIFYLHGALHLFDGGDRLTKFTWIRTGVRLIDQVRVALAVNQYPLVVSEGSSREKLTKITHSAYLSHGLRSFAALPGTRALFTFGHSFSRNDDHIIGLIPSGNVQKLFVSVHGTPSRDLVRRLEEIEAVRGDRAPLSIQLFDASSARVWR